MKPLHAALIPVMFSHWVGWEISLGYILILVMAFLLVKLSHGQLQIYKVSIGIFLISSFFIIVNSINLIYPSTDLVFSNLYQYLSLFLVVEIVLLSPPWKISEISNGACAIFWIAFYSVAIESFMINIFDISKEIMPGFRDTYGYYEDFMGWHRPFGLTGQTSANGGILLISFLLLAELNLVDIKKNLALFLGGLLTISGQAILSIIFIFGVMQLNNIHSKLFKYIFIVILLVSILLLLNLDMFQKLSLDYLIYVLWDKAYISENISALNGWELLFGTLGQNIIVANYGTEVFLVESIRLFGLVFTILFWVFVWFLMRKARLRFIFFAACFIASLHYPTVFYIEAQLPLALLYLSTLSTPHPLSLKNNRGMNAASLSYSGQHPM